MRPMIIAFIIVLNLYAGIHGFIFLRTLFEKFGKKIKALFYWPLFLALAAVYFFARYGGRGGIFRAPLSYWGLLLFTPCFIFADLLFVARLFSARFLRKRKAGGQLPRANDFLFKTHILIIAAGLSALCFGSWQARRPVITNYEVFTEKPLPDESLKIILVTDVHIGAMVHKKQLEKMVEKINSLEGDIVLAAGDIIDRDMVAYNEENLGEEWSRLRAPLGVYAAPGNHEYIGSRLDELTQKLAAAGVKILADEAVLVNGAFYVAGRNDYSAPRRGGERKPLAELTEGLDRSFPLIVMDHQPRALDEAGNNGVDLALSGHTHKGQIWPVSLITKKMYENHYGLSYKDKTAVIVSSGYGTWGPPLRFGTKSEIVCIELKSRQNP